MRLAERMSSCRRCGQPLNAGEAICPACGLSVRPTAADPTPPPAQPWEGSPVQNAGQTVSRRALRMPPEAAPQHAAPASALAPMPQPTPPQPTPPPATVDPVPVDPAFGNLAFPMYAAPDPIAAATPTGPATPAIPAIPAPATPAIPLEQWQVAGLANRLAARMLDGAIYLSGLLVVYLVIGVLGYVAGLISTTLGNVVGLVGFLVLFIYFFAAMAYLVVPTARVGQTVGKQVLGVKVVDIQTGGPLGLGGAVLHEVVLGLMAMPCYLGYISFFTDSTGRHRALHDLAAKDVVLQVAPVPFTQAVRNCIAVFRTR